MSYFPVFAVCVAVAVGATVIQPARQLDDLARSALDVGKFSGELAEL
jgi:hypothetical protein